jgi:Domain of unknown function (DUF3850)
MSKHHEIKIYPKWFDLARTQCKRFEVRKNDRDYQIGDTIKMREWGHETYSGWFLTATISSTYSGEGVADGYCVFGYVNAEVGYE